MPHWFHWPDHGGYNFVSGALADVTLATAFLSWLILFWHKHNCHVHRCWRIAKQQVVGTSCFDYVPPEAAAATQSSPDRRTPEVSDATQSSADRRAPEGSEGAPTAHLND